MRSAIQPISRSVAGVPRSGNAAQPRACKASIAVFEGDNVG
jgi:hypothetical protein